MDLLGNGRVAVESRESVRCMIKTLWEGMLAERWSRVEATERNNC